MIVDPAKAKALIARPIIPAVADELRRQDTVFFVGGQLPPRQTLETIFESDCQSPAELFVFSFTATADFQQAEALVRSIKRNFKGFLVGQFHSVPSRQLLEHAYAAGIDFIDIPLSGDRESRLAALHYAQTVFPRWSTISTLFAGAQAPSATLRDIDLLLADGILPLVAIGAEAAHYPEAEIAAVFAHLSRGWRRRKATVKPLHPLLYLTTPFAPPPKKGVVNGLFDKVNDARLRTTSDLRRLLRVREVEESFESAGL
jgi:hypothetical protein